MSVLKRVVLGAGIFICSGTVAQAGQCLASYSSLLPAGLSEAACCQRLLNLGWYAEAGLLCPGGGGGGMSAVQPPSGGGNSVAAAAGIASGILGIAAALVSQATRSDPSSADQALAFKSREMNRRGIRALENGAYGEAINEFRLASDYARQAGNYAEATDYQNNRSIAQAQIFLRDGLALERKGQLIEANRKYLEAKELAELAGRRDVAAQIASYNDALHRRAQSTGSPDVRPSQTYCTYINTRLVCQ